MRQSSWKLNRPRSRKMILLSVLLLVCCLFASSSERVEGSQRTKSVLALTSPIPGKIKTNLRETYGVIIDCGSSGSRARIFKWESWHRYPKLLDKIEIVRDEKGTALSKKIHPGLSSLMYNPEQAFEYLQPIIEFIKEKIPSKSHKATSIYVLATAGMRLLDSETQLEIMNDLVEDFKTENSFASFKTSVISGASEGMYQWITVNSRSKRFKDNSNKGIDYPLVNSGAEVAPIQRAGADSNTLGLIEMGGASIQVTYQLTDRIKQAIKKQLKSKSLALYKAFEEQIIEPKISKSTEGFNYKLVSTTFLGFGSNSARFTFVDLLVNKEIRQNKLKYKIQSLYTRQRPLVLKDPCLPVGSSETVTRPARVLTLPEESKQTIGFNIEEDDVTVSVHLVGTGNYNLCYTSLLEMLLRSKSERLNCKPTETGCTMELIGEHFVPFNEFEFLGLSDFYYTTNEMLEMSGNYHKEAVVSKSKEICNMPYKKLLILYPSANRFDKSRVLRECFKAVWMDVFLSFALNMPERYQNFNTVGKINGDEIDWTLGAVLDNSLNMELAAEAPVLDSTDGEEEEEELDEEDEPDEEDEI